MCIWMHITLLLCTSMHENAVVAKGKLRTDRRMRGGPGLALRRSQGAS